MLAPAFGCGFSDLAVTFGTCSASAFDPTTGLPFNNTDDANSFGESIGLGGMWEFDLDTRQWSPWDAAHKIQNFTTCTAPPGE